MNRQHPLFGAAPYLPRRLSAFIARHSKAHILFGDAIGDVLERSDCAAVEYSNLGGTRLHFL